MEKIEALKLSKDYYSKINKLATIIFAVILIVFTFGAYRQVKIGERARVLMDCTNSKCVYICNCFLHDK